MGTFSIWHWLVVLVVVLVLFGGGGKISRLMGDFGKGLKSFKKSMKEDEGEDAPAVAEKRAIDADKADASVAEPAPESNKAANS